MSRISILCLLITYLYSIGFNNLDASGGKISHVRLVHSRRLPVSIPCYCRPLRGPGDMAASGLLLGSCPLDADNQFGPRIDVACRPFDFTLLFEDACFVGLPAVLFLLFLPWRLRMLWKTPVKMNSHRLATWKLVNSTSSWECSRRVLTIHTQALLSALLVFHLLFLVLSLRTPSLHTRFSACAGILSSAAVLAAGVLSFVEDQRSVQPSDLLVVYFSASAILSIPRLRSLWLAPSVHAPMAIWTIIFISTAGAIFFESVGKSKSLQPRYQNVTKEQTAGFWSRGFFVWVLPFFQTGYSQIITLRDIPKVDDDLSEEVAWTKLDAYWRRTAGRNRLFRAMFAANAWPFFSAVPPRLTLSAFILCQPFLIELVVSYLLSRTHKNQEEYGHAIIGAFVLLYLGIAVSSHIAYLLLTPPDWPKS